MRMRVGKSATSEAGRTARAAAFEAEALASVDSLYRTALRLTRVPADAEDLVQDTYLKAFRAADRFEPGTNLRAWLFTILHNTARNRARDRARDSVMVDSDIVERAADAPHDGSAGAETPESLLLRDTLAPELQAAIDELPDAFRQAVWLRDVEEFSYAEIAEMFEHSRRDRDVAHFARPPDALRSAASSETCQCLIAPPSTRSSRPTSTARSLAADRAGPRTTHARLPAVPGARQLASARCASSSRARKQALHAGCALALAARAVRRRRTRGRPCPAGAVCGRAGERASRRSPSPPRWSSSSAARSSIRSPPGRPRDGGGARARSHEVCAVQQRARHAARRGPRGAVARIGFRAGRRICRPSRSRPGSSWSASARASTARAASRT